ncbi:MAG: transposase [Candidatus Aureabacteria bacterium]|nr:transposase [Candidatus Auribacterota bacterium]
MVSSRKDALVNGEVYHVFTKSIAGYTVFNDDSEYLRMLDTLRYYQRESPAIKYSRYIKLIDENALYQDELRNLEKLVDIIAYCLMPTHIHCVLRQLKDNGITIFMSNTLNSYTKYFNSKHKRKGPLWQGRFKNVLINTQEQLLHMTRYLHLNPVTSYLTNKAEDWPVSSYSEYINRNKNEEICYFRDVLQIEPDSYKKFVNQRASYQRDLACIKNLIME